MIKRNTIQRSLVLETVNLLHCHATADTIYEHIARHHPTVSRGTVYRNLNQLSEDGVIQKIEVPGGADRFDHQCHNHYHIKCLKCGGIFDVDMEYIPGFENSIKDTHGFQIKGYSIMFQGICPSCNK